MKEARLFLENGRVVLETNNGEQKCSYRNYSMTSMQELIKTLFNQGTLTNDRT